VFTLSEVDGNGGATPAALRQRFDEKYGAGSADRMILRLVPGSS
jgi:hypothetical protein